MDRQSGRVLGSVAATLVAGIAIAFLPVPSAHAAAVFSVSGPVFLVRDGIAGKSLVRSGTTLQEADVLTGETKDAAALIECDSQGDAHALSGEFEAVIVSSSDDKPCVIDLRAGTAVATRTPTATPVTMLRAGPVAMASIHTQFGIHVTRGEAGAPGATSTFVLDGSATCRDSRRPDKVWTLKSGEQIDPERGLRSSIDDETYERLARMFAKLDAVQVLPPEPALVDKLTAAWLAVLHSPDDAPARHELARLQAFSKSALAQYQQARSRELAQMPGDR
jgi:hypothetical protein